ncbi:suppressor of cytokine signaling 2 [Protopterus annectens]|uniref:suppressor of cytokine signaling 2 n=1 Tax=Protopterus annectens TaxID=7888 RepID=UPI001CF94ED4|nr:suppressor of cytokine signaling 2 [Protopterus annectens]
MTCQSGDSTESIERRPGAEARVLDPDKSRVAVAMKELKRTGWYWGPLTASEAKDKLQDASDGTFLVRDSSHRDFLLTISVKTPVGPTNLRIEYREGKFRLDSLVLVKPKLKQFNSVVCLVEYYVVLSRSSQGSEALARPNGTVQLYLSSPLYTEVPSLQHLSRIAINKSARNVDELPLPKRLKDFLKEYSHHI